jgi:pimeloyl-ACP methyl ester carboxylesterase
MGGYLTLAILEKYPERLNSAVLLHSHCYSDSDEKKNNRSREIGLIKDGKKELIINTSIPNLYANENLETFTEQVIISKNIALQTGEDGIISGLNAMKSRPDRSIVLRNTDVPVLLVGGRKDNLIPYEMMEKMKAISPAIKLVCLEKSGHLGFIEEKDLASVELKKFFDDNFECM